MEKQRLSKKDIVDLIIAEATHRLFTGDNRDGEAPPIMIQNFLHEMMRHGARVMRSRLSRLSVEELVNEASATFDYVELLQGERQENLQLADRIEREDVRQALQLRQAELGRRPRLQMAILAAARHYRTSGKNAKLAWQAIEKSPFLTTRGERVVIEDGILRVESRDRMQKERALDLNSGKRGIGQPSGEYPLNPVEGKPDNSAEPG